MNKKTVMYNSDNLDTLATSIHGCVVQRRIYGELESEYELDAEETVAKIAGILVEKYFGMPSEIHAHYERKFKCNVISYVNYGNGSTESFTYILL